MDAIQKAIEALEQVLDDGGYMKDDDTFFTPDEKPHGGGYCAAAASLCVGALADLRKYRDENARLRKSLNHIQAQTSLVEAVKSAQKALEGNEV